MLQRKQFPFLTLLLGAAGIAGFLMASPAAASESIQDFQAGLEVRKDGSIAVTETITYDFGKSEHHGITRDIPLSSSGGKTFSAQVTSIRDQNSRPYPFQANTSNGVLQVRIGDPDVLVSGIHVYVISYETRGVPQAFPDHDEIYWNVTGSQWAAPIALAEARVRLPDGDVPVTLRCFAGPEKAALPNCNAKQDGADIAYAASQVLSPGEGFTIVLGLPKGYIAAAAPAPAGGIGSAFVRFFDSPGFVLFFLGSFLGVWCVLLASHLLTGKRKLSKPRPIIPKELRHVPVTVQYAPPDGLPAVDLGALLDRRVDMTDLSSVIIDLAIRGYLKIRAVSHPRLLLPAQKDFEFVRLKDGTDLSHPADRWLFSLLFSGRDEISLEGLRKQGDASSLRKVQTDTEQHLRDRGYYDRSAAEKGKRETGFLAAAMIGTFIIALAAFFLPASAALPAIGGGAWTLFVASAAFLVARVIRLSHALTPQGISVIAKTLGFREFLRLVEKDRLRLLNAPAVKPETFEKYLPYAMVFGVEEEWAKKFSGIYKVPPSWYEGNDGAIFNSAVFASNLSSLGKSFDQAVGISGASGLGSGGFSGGGFGGGGGGSW